MGSDGKHDLMKKKSRMIWGAYHSAEKNRLNLRLLNLKIQMYGKSRFTSL